jgi:hypothetical protein
MNATPTSIEIFKPFGEAFELMKKILFQPFDISKWCVIGFAAFLAGNFGGGGGFTGRFPNGKHATNASLPWHGSRDFHHWPWVTVFVIIFLAILALVLLLMWIRARAIFIFTDCIVRNRGAIKEPWREYRHEGDSYFLFSLLFAFAMMAIFAVVAGLFVLLIWVVNLPDTQKTILFIILGVLIFLAWMLFALVFGLISYFMPPIMYLRRCRALDAFREVLHLLRANPAVFVLFGLFTIVLFLGLMVAGMIATCATCCLAALPYVGTVIMLPALVWIRAFGLLFLRQFGPDYDVWKGKPPLSHSALPPPLPA